MLRDRTILHEIAFTNRLLPVFLHKTLQLLHSLVTRARFSFGQHQERGLFKHAQCSLSSDSQPVEQESAHNKRKSVNRGLSGRTCSDAESAFLVLNTRKAGSGYEICSYKIEGDQKSEVTLVCFV